MLMRLDGLYKFSDGTLTRLLNSLEDITKNIHVKYMPKRRWSSLEKKRAHIMIKAINKLQKERRLMRSLEKCMDKSKITRKQSKASRHGHENQKSTKPKPRNVKPQLTKRVKRLERQRTSSTSQPRRRKYRQVKSSDDDLDEEDASKQGRSSDKPEPILCIGDSNPPYEEREFPVSGLYSCDSRAPHHSCYRRRSLLEGIDIIARGGL
ncbi:hypothetical protein Tco_0929369 [Tanacetum coccineum]